jgi:preprotein translocase subunit SecD
MLNQYPLWKYLLILAVLVVGIILALPNLYGTDPALQISAKSDEPVTAAAQKDVEQALTKAKIAFRGLSRENKGLVVRFDSIEDQLKAMDVVRDALGNKYIVAQNLLPASPPWLEALGAKPMYLGLDLRGGLHFLLKVGTETVLEDEMRTLANDFRTTLRENKIRNSGIRIQPKTLTVKFKTEEQRDQAMDALKKSFDRVKLSTDEADGSYMVHARLTEVALRDLYKAAIKQNISTLRKRVNELGVAEPIIQQEGLDRIVVELPGIQDSALAKEILKTTASLRFQLVDMDADVAAAVNGHIPPGSELYYTSKKITGEHRPVVLKKRTVVTGEHITNASATFDQNGRPAVSVTLDSVGGNIMANTTKRNLQKSMAVVFIEHTNKVVKENGKEHTKEVKQEEVINVATIQGVFSKRFQIYGLSSTAESNKLALFLRSGALKAPVQIVEERTVGPSLGQQSINQGMVSVIIGLALVVGFMAFYYRGFGMVANLALVANLVLIVALLSLFQATLTLPGIAGIVLTIGMAVDANVLIFERIREELRVGNTPQRSIASGYDKALSTIADANITTLIAALMLFVFGTGPIKGFAVTLSFGIITSMFTAIMGTRAIINLAIGGKKLKDLSI